MEIEDVFIMPDESYEIVRFTQNDLPGHAAVNAALVDFERKELFSWHLSILIEADDLRENGFPTPEEQEILVEFEDKLEPELKKHGNALVFASVTHNGNRELIYRVHDPEPANEYIQSIIKNKDHPRYFDYRIDPDEDWEKTEWYLNALNNK